MNTRIGSLVLGVVFAILSLCPAARSAVFDFDDGTAQGWTLGGAYNGNGVNPADPWLGVNPAPWTGVRN